MPTPDSRGQHCEQGLPSLTPGMLGEPTQSQRPHLTFSHFNVDVSKSSQAMRGRIWRWEGVGGQGQPFYNPGFNNKNQLH